jgi:hypothetical protein
VDKAAEVRRDSQAQAAGSCMRVVKHCVINSAVICVLSLAVKFNVLVAVNENYAERSPV